MWPFIKLRKAAEESLACEKKYRVAILGDTATQLLSTCLRGELYLGNQNAEVFDADYNQILPLSLDSASELYLFHPDYIVLYPSVEVLYSQFQMCDPVKRESFASLEHDKWVNILNSIQSNCKAKIILFNYIERNDMVFGSYALNIPSSFLYQVKKLNMLMMEETSLGFSLLDINSIATEYGYSNLHTDSIYDLSTLAINTNFLPMVSSRLKDRILSMRGIVYKCIILDLDNTLWGGVIGDDGIEQIQIGELGAGRAFLRFQKWLKELSYRGILLAVCSKNNLETAQEPFLKLKEMALRLEDFSIFVANWNDKASNIRLIQHGLNIGFDSMVFVDDNPFERGLVKSQLPEVLVPDMPKDPSEYVSYLQSLNLFEASSYSAEDRMRTRQYREEARRRTTMEECSSIEEFLTSLHMVSEFSPFQPIYFSRIAQLSQRSNQFNLRTIRYTFEDIERIAKDENYLTMQFSLKDDFGDSGLISFLILRKRESALFIDTWIMSCRVLKRTMEEFVINELVKEAEKLKFEKIVGEYIPTKKNSMVKDIYPRMGFASEGENLYSLEVKKYKKQKTYIEGERK
jgi:FkbH-like protein